jgi:hypothetical protein
MDVSPVMHEQHHDGAGEQEQERQRAVQVGAMLRDQEEGDHRAKAQGAKPRERAPKRRISW